MLQGLYTILLHATLQGVILLLCALFPYVFTSMVHIVHVIMGIFGLVGICLAFVTKLWC